MIENEESRQLIGVVTDRDLCLAVIAEGRNPHTVQVRACMTGSPMSCHPEDKSGKAVELMDHQIRRIPIVN